jgi:hypothetical protein
MGRLGFECEDEGDLPLLDWTKVRTEHVRRALRGMEWSERRRAADLLRIEELILDSACGWMSAISRSQDEDRLKRELREDWLAILKESSPKRLQEFLDKEAEEEAAAKDAAAEAVRRLTAKLEASKAAWVSVGGVFSN